jgi:hypothetical protein
MTKEENPQTQERDFPLSWKAQTPRFPHSHRTATAAVLASTPNQSHNHGLRYLLLYRLTHRFLGGSLQLRCGTCARSVATRNSQPSVQVSIANE